MEILGLSGWALVAILFFAGISFIILEVFLPGLILGIIGASLLILSTVAAFATGGITAGLLMAMVSTVGTIFTILMALKVLPETPFGKKWIPKHAITSVSNETPPLQPGQTGQAKTVLRPTGIAIIDGKRYDVESQIGLLEKDTPVRVVRVEGSRIVVTAQK